MSDLHRSDLPRSVWLTVDAFTHLTAERDRARDLAARLEQICAERSRLLWLAIEPQPSYIAQAAVGRAIARHLRETEFIAGVTDV